MLKSKTKKPIVHEHFALDYEGKKHVASNNIGYIHYHNSKNVLECGAPLFDFRATDQSKIRQSVLHMIGKKNGIHVYYKAGVEWIQIPKNFTHFRETFAWWNMPFVVIVEYTFD